MSQSITPIDRIGFDVLLGDMTFHVSHWKIQTVRHYAEQNALSGTVFVTNSGRRAHRLTLEGSLPFHNDPGEVILALDAAMNENKRFVFTFRGVRYVAAMLSEYTISEQAADSVLSCRIELIIANTLNIPPEEEVLP